ncbi:MAG: MFS transporter [Thermoprotei archaeon]
MQYKNTVLTNTTVAAFMAFLDSNIVVISLPTIVRELPGTTAFDAVWLIMGYSLVSATVLLTLGRLGDIFGRVKLYNAGFAVFTIGSGLCSISWNGGVLVLFRMIQGLGGAMIFANNNAILTDAFPIEERGRAIGTNQVVGIAGSVIALVAGGILTSTLGWRSIFWINLPVGTFATLWAYAKLHEVKTVSKESIDYVGNLLFAPGLGLVLFSSTIGALQGFGLQYVSLLVLGLLLIAGFVYIELHVAHPMVDMRLFRIREFASGAAANLLNSIARGGLSLVLVIYLQGALFLSALQSGLDLVPFSLAFVSSGPLSGFLSDKYGSRPFVTAGIVIGSAALLWFALLPAGAPYTEIVAPMILAGFGGGVFAAPNLASIMNAVPSARRGVASGMSSLLFNVGLLLSITMSFIIMAVSIPRTYLELIFAGLPAPSGLNLQLFGRAMHETFIAMAVVNAFAVVPVLVRWTSKRTLPEKTIGANVAVEH